MYVYIDVVRDQTTDKLKNKEENQHFLRMILCHCWAGRAGMCFKVINQTSLCLIHSAEHSGVVMFTFSI